MHHLHNDALVITTKVANNNVHRMFVYNRSVVDIIYLDVYNRMGITESKLSLMTSPLYKFTRDHVIPKGTIKLAVTVGEHPRVSKVMNEFLILDCPSTFNRVIGRSLLKALKAVTSIYHLMMTFPTAKGTGQVQGG